MCLDEMSEKEVRNLLMAFRKISGTDRSIDLENWVCKHMYSEHLEAEELCFYPPVPLALLSPNQSPLFCFQPFQLSLPRYTSLDIMKYQIFHLIEEDQESTV